MILEICSFYAPGIVERLALSPTPYVDDDGNPSDGGYQWQPFQGAYVVVAEGAVLPSDAQFAAWAATYDADIAAVRAQADRDAEIRALKAKLAALGA